MQYVPTGARREASVLSFFFPLFLLFQEVIYPHYSYGETCEWEEGFIEL